MSSYLQLVEFKNFKTFRNTTFGPFKPKTFYVIVGPNGVGKSNFVDGLAFVMAEQNLEKLRVSLKKDLRCFSSLSHHQEEDCWVAAQFILQEGPKKFKCIHGGAGDIFMIDLETVHYDVYQEQLRAAKVDVNFPNLIVHQGSITTMALASPKEITNLFETVSRSAAFHQAYRELSERQFKLSNNFVLAKRVQNLTNTCLKETLLRETANSEIVDVKNQLENAEQTLALLILYHQNRLMEGMESKLNQQRMELTKINIEISNIQSELNEKIKIHEDLSCEEPVLQTKLKHAEYERNKTIMKAQKKVELLEKKLRCIKESCTEAYSKLKENEKNQNHLKQREVNIKNAYEKLQDFSSGDCTCQVEMESQCEEYCGLKKHASNMASEIYQKLVSSKRAQACDLIQLESLQCQQKVLRDEINRKVAGINELAVRQMQLEQEIRLTEDTFGIKALTKEISSCENELDSITKQIEDIDLKRDTSEALFLKESSAEALRDALGDHVVGRLGEVGFRLRGKYGNVIAKVLLDYKDCIVVQSNAIAEKCTDVLAKEKFQREVFLPIDEIKAEMKAAQRQPPVGTLMSEIIPWKDCDLKEVVRYLTKGIVICKSEEEANIARANGFGIVMNDNRQSDERDPRRRARAQLEDRKAILIEDLARLRSCFTRKERADLLKAAGGHGMKINFLKQDLKSVMRQRKWADTQVSDMTSDSEGIQNQLAELNESTSRRVDELNELNSQLASVDNEIFRDFCDRVGIANINEYEEPCKACKVYQEKKSELISEHNIIRSELGVLDTRISEAKAKLSSWEDQVAKLEMQLSDARKELNDRLESAKKIERTINKLHRMIFSISEELRKLKRNIPKIEEQVCHQKKAFQKASKTLWNYEAQALGLQSQFRQAYLFLLMNERVSIEDGSPQANLREGISLEENLQEGNRPEETSEEETLEDQTLEDQTLEDQTLEDQTLEDQTLEDQTLEDQTLEDQTLEDQILEDQILEEQILEEQILEEQTSPERTSPERTSPERTSPERTLPERTLPERTSPEGTSSERTSSERTSSERTSSERTLSEEISQEGTIPEEISQEGTSSLSDSNSISSGLSSLLESLGQTINFSRLDAKLKHMTNCEDIVKTAAELHEKQVALREKLEGLKERAPKEMRKSRKEAEEDAENARKDLRKVVKRMDKARDLFEKVKTERRQCFMACYRPVSQVIDAMFKLVMMSDRAGAELIPMSDTEVFLGGITMECWLPDKPGLPRACLSGGEQSMLAVAFILSFDNFVRPPIFVVDEIDSDTDQRNMSNLASLFLHKRETSQVVAVSHRPSLQISADVLILILKDGSVAYLDHKPYDENRIYE